MKELKKLYPAGWLLYCPKCREYVDQSTPKDSTRGKSVLVDDEPCKKCTEKRDQEIIEAQRLLGRLGLPKENQNEEAVNG